MCETILVLETAEFPSVLSKGLEKKKRKVLQATKLVIAFPPLHLI